MILFLAIYPQTGYFRRYREPALTGNPYRERGGYLTGLKRTVPGRIRIATGFLVPGTRCFISSMLPVKRGFQWEQMSKIGLYLHQVRLIRCHGQNGSSRNNQRKKSGTGTSILSRNEHVLRGNGTTSSDDMCSIDRMSDFIHNIRWNELHVMVCMHVLDYFLCNLTIIHSGCHEWTIQSAILATTSLYTNRLWTSCNILIIII